MYTVITKKTRTGAGRVSQKPPNFRPEYRYSLLSLEERLAQT